MHFFEKESEEIVSTAKISQIPNFKKMFQDIVQVLLILKNFLGIFRKINKKLTLRGQ